MDDMRHKRLSRAEEKAYSLPAKLSVAMMVCIFPVLFVVILLRSSSGSIPGIIERRRSFRFCAGGL
jgi:pilus assembly protein TadC